MFVGADAHSTSDALDVGSDSDSERQPLQKSVAAEILGVIETPPSGTSRETGHSVEEQRGPGILPGFGGERPTPSPGARLLRQDDLVRKVAYPLVSRRAFVGPVAGTEPSVASPARKVFPAAMPTIEPMMVDMPADTSPWRRASSRMSPFTISRMATSGPPLSIPMPTTLHSLALARDGAWSRDPLLPEAKPIDRVSMTPVRLSMNLLQLAARADEIWPADGYISYKPPESRDPDVTDTSRAVGGLAAHAAGEAPPPTLPADGIPALKSQHIPTFAQRSADESWAADWYASPTPPELTAPALAQTSRAAVPLPAHAVRGPPPATFPIGIRESISRPSLVLQHRVHASLAADGSRDQSTDSAFERQAMARDESAPAHVVVGDVVPKLDGRDNDHGETRRGEAAVPATALDVGSPALALVIRSLHPPSIMHRAAHGSHSAIWQRRPESMMLLHRREGSSENTWHASTAQRLHLSHPFIQRSSAVSSAILRHGAVPNANVVVGMVAPMRVPDHAVNDNSASEFDVRGSADGERAHDGRLQNEVPRGFAQHPRIAVLTTNQAWIGRAAAAELPLVRTSTFAARAARGGVDRQMERPEGPTPPSNAEGQLAGAAALSAPTLNSGSPKQLESSTRASSVSGVDLDELAERTLKKLVRMLAIEKERRGITP